MEVKMKLVNIETNVKEFDGLKNQSEFVNYFRNINAINSKKYLIKTWGCQMNEHDSENLSGIFDLMGFIKTDEQEEADIVLFNTCAVREKAETKVIGNLGHLKNLKSRKPELKIVVAGCMPEEDVIVKTFKSKYKFLDLVIGTHSYHKFPRLLKEAYTINKTRFDVDDKEDIIIENLPTNRDYGVKAFVNIMHGCNNFCTYCIVPYTRGRERSRQPEDIIKEITDLVSNGVKEVTLLGQNVNSYGKTEKFDVDFADLLEQVNNIEGLERIRFMTSNPKDMTYKLIDNMKKLDKVCEFLHLPIQAASNKILKKMNRNYTVESYLEKIDYAKENIEGLTLSTDIIIGFPGETDEDIERLIELFKTVKYHNVFTFIYSKRKGTPANDYEDQIEKSVKKERFNRILEISNNIAKENSMKYMSKTVEVLVEGKSKHSDGVMTGKTRGFKTVDFTGDIDLVGKLVDIEITKCNSFSLFGKIKE
jgi:tRNA-2-methylthio-N6-dimethylallyladenosine synthase